MRHWIGPRAARPRVVAFRNDRTIARVKNIISAVLFAERLRLPLDWVWNEVDDCAETLIPFDELFVRRRLRKFYPGLTARHLTAEAFEAEGLGAKEHRVTRQPAQQLEAYWHSWEAPTLWFDKTGPVPLANDNVRALRADEIRTFQRLPICPDVTRAANAVARLCDVGSAVAIHVRRGDVVSGPQGIARAGIDVDGPRRLSLKRTAIKGFVTRYAPDQAYHRAIDQLAPDQRLMIFSDTPSAVKQLTEHFGARVTDVHTVLDRYPLTQAQRDLAEFLLLSKAKQIIGPNSAYSGFAARVGQIKMTSIDPFLEPKAIADQVVSAVADREDRAFATKFYLANCAAYLDKVQGAGAGDSLRMMAEAASPERIPRKAIHVF